jgi:hypothetical protein
MLLLKYLLLSAGIAMFVIAAGILSYDAYCCLPTSAGVCIPILRRARPDLLHLLRMRWRTRPRS